MSVPFRTLPLVLAVSALLSAGTASAADSLTFEAARARFHERADIFRADAAEVERARQVSESAKSLSGPKVDITAMQVEGRKDLDLNLDIPASVQQLGSALTGGKYPIPSSMRFSDELDLSGPRAMISATWPLYTGGAITAQQNLLEHKVREASAAQSARLEEKDADLAMRYWGVQLARSVEELRRERLKDEEEQVHRAMRFEKKGLISRIERMSVEVSRDAARRELVSAGTSARVAEAELMSALREKELPALATPLFILTGDLGTLSEWQSRARINSPVLSRIDAQVSQAGEGVRVAESAFHPQVFAFGMKNLVKHYLTPVEPDWMVGLGIKFTLWDNRDRFSSLAASHAQEEKARAAKAEADNALASAVETAFLRTTQAREEYLLTASTVALAKENLRLREASFAEGLSTALDVREARTQMTGAQIAERAAAYKFVVSWAMLHGAAGVMPDFVATLSRPDLKRVE